MSGGHLRRSGLLSKGALVALACALLVWGLASFGMSVPSLLAAVPEALGSAGGDGSSPSARQAASDASGAGEGQTDGGENDGESPDSPEDPSDPADPSDPEAGSTDADPSDTASDAAAEEQGSAAKDPDPGSTGGGSAAAPGGSQQQPTRSESPFSKVPTAEDEERVRALLQPLASAAPGYKSQVDACVASFEADQHADLSVRLSHQRTCESLRKKLWANYIAARDSMIVSSQSRYKRDQGKLIAMYRCLTEYLGTYENAWARNVAYADPAGHEADYMAPVNADGAGERNSHLQEYYGWKAGLTL